MSAVSLEEWMLVCRKQQSRFVVYGGELEDLNLEYQGMKELQARSGLEADLLGGSAVGGRSLVCRI
jgi:hypothetical protein